MVGLSVAHGPSTHTLDLDQRAPTVVAGVVSFGPRRSPRRWCGELVEQTSEQLTTQMSHESCRSRTPCISYASPFGHCAPFKRVRLGDLLEPLVTEGTPQGGLRQLPFWSREGHPAIKLGDVVKDALKKRRWFQKDPSPMTSYASLACFRLTPSLAVEKSLDPRSLG